MTLQGKPKYKVIDTKFHKKSVGFRLLESSSQYEGLYRGLNQLFLSRPILLGDSVTVEIPPELAFDSAGLDKHYNVNAAHLALAQETYMDFGSPTNDLTDFTTGPNESKAPASHQNRNPLGIAYVRVPPNTGVVLSLELWQINNHHREIKSGCCIVM